MDDFESKPKRKILIVDDIAFNRTVLNKILTKSGYELSIATSGEQGLQMVEIVMPDLILLDYMMPGMNGLQALKIMKEDPRFKHIPVMFLTASDEIEFMTEAFDTGAVDYISKPFKAAELNARVSTQIRRLDDAEAILKKVQEQQELIHILSHDLRNPLVACRGLVELLEEGDAAIELVGPRIRDSVQKCLDTIELVRKKGLLEEDVTKLVLESLNLLDQLDGVIGDFEESFINKGIQVLNQIPDNLYIFAERTSLNNVVLSNVISNAIKFSYPNTRIELMAIESEETVELRVKDSGMGIPDYLLPMIFDPRKVSRRVGTMNEQGTGYGMGLVRKLMNCYNGSIRVESVSKSADNRKHGSTFTLTFPKATPVE
jgi:two-component system, sensor histidine kinase and response regulator